LYRKEIEKLVRLRIYYITKLEFLPVFYEVFKSTFSEQNIKSGFRATRLVLYDLENVLSYLDLKLRTPTPLLVEEQHWTSRTPQNLKEVESQSLYLTDRIVRHQDSSPSSIYDVIKHLAKGTQILTHSYVLVKAENKALQEANEVKKRRERKKKRRLQHGGSLTVQEGEKLVRDEKIEEEEEEAVRAQGNEGKRRRCRLCNQVGHNARTCQRDQDTIEVELE
jgi:hypothetical protein